MDWVNMSLALKGAMRPNSGSEVGISLDWEAYCEPDIGHRLLVKYFEIAIKGKRVGFDPVPEFCNVSFDITTSITSTTPTAATTTTTVPMARPCQLCRRRATTPLLALPTTCSLPMNVIYILWGNSDTDGDENNVRVRTRVARCSEP